jgi:hypothetical protein
MFPCVPGGPRIFADHPRHPAAAYSALHVQGDIRTGPRGLECASIAPRWGETGRIDE